MSEVLHDLVRLLELERIEHTLFRGRSQDLGFGALFGGQVLGQGLSAALQTVDASRQVHSFHAYFLRPGDPQKPVVYAVDCIRDGRSFTTRRVVAIQNGHAIFNLAASFQLPEEGFEHQADMPQVPGPEGLSNTVNIARRMQERIPSAMRDKLTAEPAIDMRTVDPVDPLDPERRAPRKYAWIRAAGALPDDPRVHQCLLAYASDFQLIGTAMLPHAVTYWQSHMQVASLDHAMWFHRPFRFDDWLLYAMDSPTASGARGLARGQLFTRSGVLVASTCQEGLIRQRSGPKAVGR